MRLFRPKSLSLTPRERAFVEQFPRGSAAIADGLQRGESVGFIGRHVNQNRAPLHVHGGLPKAGDKPFRIVSFHTQDEYYSLHAARLQKSARKFGLSVEMRAIPRIGPWELNCAYKANFIREMWEISDCPIVWVDADATFEAYPALFGMIDADFAMHCWEGWQTSSGTLYFGKTDLAKQLLDAWVTRCAADPTLWDQTHLDSALADVCSINPLRCVWLPRSYLQIFETPEAEPPVIKHWQASRSEKKTGKAISPTPPTTFTEKGQVLRHGPPLWRSPAQSFWILEGTQHIKPETGTEFPEGFDVSLVLRASLENVYPVLEIGCGVGRLAATFEAREYRGVDINPNAVKVARDRLSGHDIHVHDIGMVYPKAPAAFVYTVLLHVPDAELDEQLAEMVEGRELFVIAELMDPKWRRDGNPPVFNRSAETYVSAMKALGFNEAARSVHLYRRYANFRTIANPDITFLTFRRF